MRIENFVIYAKKLFIRTVMVMKSDSTYRQVFVKWFLDFNENIPILHIKLDERIKQKSYKITTLGRKEIQK